MFRQRHRLFSGSEEQCEWQEGQLSNVSRICSGCIATLEAVEDEAM
jgi:hypothetical protein